MYEHDDDLRERPVDLTPNPRFPLLTPSHAEALSTAELLAAQTPSTVCAVDADLVAPSLHRHFAVGNLPGLANAADTSMADLARGLQRNLWIISAGTDGPPSRAGVDATRAQLTDCITQFDYVLVNNCASR
jgi:Mrp family chromosome partitioning ATPase